MLRESGVGSRWNIFNKQAFDLLFCETHQAFYFSYKNSPDFLFSDATLCILLLIFQGCYTIFTYNPFGFMTNHKSPHSISIEINKHIPWFAILSKLSTLADFIDIFFNKHVSHQSTESTLNSMNLFWFWFYKHHKLYDVYF